MAAVGLKLSKEAYLFSNDPLHADPWNPDWVSHQVSNLADDAGVDLNVKKLRHYTASQLRAWGADSAVPVIDCTAGERKHLIAEE